MKTVNAIAKLLVALAAIAGAVYVIATYGEQIVAWCKKMLGSCPCSRDGECECCEDGECTCDGECDCCCEETCEAPAEEPAEEPVEEAPVVDETEPVAEDADFES